MARAPRRGVLPRVGSVEGGADADTLNDGADAVRNTDPAEPARRFEAAPRQLALDELESAWLAARNEPGVAARALGVLAHALQLSGARGAPERASAVQGSRKRHRAAFRSPARPRRSSDAAFATPRLA